MPDQREPLDAERVGERENVVDQQVGLIGLDVLRQVRSCEPSLVGHHQEEFVLQPRRDLAPRPVRLRKAVEQDHRRMPSVTGHRHVERHSCL